LSLEFNSAREKEELDCYQWRFEMRLGVNVTMNGGIGYGEQLMERTKIISTITITFVAPFGSFEVQLLLHQKAQASAHRPINYQRDLTIFPRCALRADVPTFFPSCYFLSIPNQLTPSSLARERRKQLEVNQVQLI
jgi:hypothetical protein